LRMLSTTSGSRSTVTLSYVWQNGSM
jgi:hypothetical protein